MENVGVYHSSEKGYENFLNKKICWDFSTKQKDFHQRCRRSLQSDTPLGYNGLAKSIYIVIPTFPNYL